MSSNNAPLAHPPEQPRPLVELDIFDEAGGVRSVRLLGPRATIGRAPDAAIQLDHYSVSRHHAQLVRDPFSRWWLRDLGSRNGTKLDGQIIHDDVVVTANHDITVGRFRMRLRRTEPDELSVMGAADAVVVDEPHASLSTLDPARMAAISAAHLSAILQLGQKLSVAESAIERTSLLCASMVEEPFRGWSALILRADPRDSGSTPKILRHDERATHESTPHNRRCISRSLLRLVLRTQRPSLGSSTAGGADVRITADPASAARSAIACPLRCDEGAVYLLYVTVPEECATPEWLTLISLAATQFQHAEAESRARQRAREEAEVRQDLQRAEAIQRRIIPSRVDFNGLDVSLSWLPCRWVGGDYADVVPIDERRVVVAVGDVCGKGLQGALIVSSLHAILRAAVHAGHALGNCVMMANHHFSTYLPAGSFITFLAVSIDTVSGECEYVNAGHPPPILIEPCGARSILGRAGSPPLGITSQDIGGESFTLAPETTLALCTDGWTELADNAGVQLGINGFAEAIGKCVAAEPHAAIDRLKDRAVESLDAFRRGSLVADDRTLVLVRRNGHPPK